jgi:trk system potassium uptake protein TrkA
MVEGDALARDVLHRAEIEKAEGLAAVTDSESLNAVLAHVARSIYSIPNVVVRSFNPGWRKIHDTLGIQAVGSASRDVQRMEEMLTQPSVRVLFSSNNAAFAVYEFVVPKGWGSQDLQDVLPESQYHVLWCNRAGSSIPLASLQTLEPGDVIYLTTTQEGIATLRHRMSSTEA